LQALIGKQSQFQSAISVLNQDVDYALASTSSYSDIESKIAIL
jgi:hypothetical protein